MAGERFVLLGVARARSQWFRDLAQWATSAAIPAEFVKCVSAEEVRAHLATGRTFSAVVVDGGLPSVDRDLIAAARDAGCPVIVVDDGRGRRDWRLLGATAVMPSGFDREQLLDALASHAPMVGGGDALSSTSDDQKPIAGRLGRVVAVCGPGGTGASVAAIALAQHFAARDREGPSVVLADLALRADQAMLHDARDIVPGVQELVEAHRGRSPGPEEVRRQTFAIEPHGYHLLIGLRRPRYWSTVRPRAFEAALDSLQHTFATVICDVTADFEGEREGGSVDVEERNLLARSAVLRADAVVVVGGTGVKGLHALVRTVGEVLELGVAAERLVPVINVAPRNPRVRAEMTAAFNQLLQLPRESAAVLAPPVFLPRRRVDQALRDGAQIPAPLGPVLAGAVQATWARNTRRAAAPVGGPTRVIPGTVGTWAGEGAQ